MNLIPNKIGLDERSACVFGEHFSKDFLHCHYMAARIPPGKEIAGAYPSTIDIAREMRAIGTLKINTEISYVDSRPLPGILVGFFDSADKIRTHITP